MKKAILVGDRKAGKSALLHRLTSDAFEDEYVPTATADFVALSLADGDTITSLQLWDLPGGFDEDSSVSVSRDDVLVFVFDLTNPSSLARLHEYRTAAQSAADARLPTVVVGTHTDLLDRTPFTPAEVKARFEASTYVEVSAKTAQNFDQLRDALARAANGPGRSRRRKLESVVFFGPPNAGKSTLIKRMCEGTFSGTHRPSTRAVFEVCDVSIGETSSTFLLWETTDADSEVLPKNIHMAFLVVMIGRESTVESVLRDAQPCVERFRKMSTAKLQFVANLHDVTSEVANSLLESIAGALAIDDFMVCAPKHQSQQSVLHTIVSKLGWFRDADPACPIEFVCREKPKADAFDPHIQARWGGHRKGKVVPDQPEEPSLQPKWKPTTARPRGLDRLRGRFGSQTVKKAKASMPGGGSGHCYSDCSDSDY